MLLVKFYLNFPPPLHPPLPPVLSCVENKIIHHHIAADICDRARINQPYAAEHRNYVMVTVLKRSLCCVLSYF